MDLHALEKRPGADGYLFGKGPAWFAFVMTLGLMVVDSTLLAVKGSLWMTRPAMVHYAAPRSQMLAMADELFGHVQAGRIVGEPKQTFALADAADAHRALESRKTTGATVLVP